MKENIAKKDDKRTQILERTLRQREMELKSHYIQIGKHLLEIAEREQKEVNRLVDDIIRIRKTLVHTQHAIQCTNCFSFHAANSRFCSFCGKKLNPASIDGKEPEHEKE